MMETCRSDFEDRGAKRPCREFTKPFYFGSHEFDTNSKKGFHTKMESVLVAIKKKHGHIAEVEVCISTAQDDINSFQRTAEKFKKKRELLVNVVEEIEWRIEIYMMFS